jgi:hypothetical protein
MKLTVSYDVLYNDWYAGEFYNKFFNYLKDVKRIDVEYISSNELAKIHGSKVDYNNGYPSVFHPLNLIIQNKLNGKTFIHSWHDYAPAILEFGSGIEHFDVVKFSCVSRLDQDIINRYWGKIDIQPSIYLLENTSELNLIEKNRKNNKIYNKVYMNALCYDVRERIIDVLNTSEFFNLRKKNKGDFLTKNKYYEEFSKYKFSLSLDGAAKICYRDLESFGLGCLLLREKLDVLTYDPLIIDKHYIELIDDDIKSKIYLDNHISYIVEKVENKINEIVTSGFDKFIINESRLWYERNCIPDNQMEIIYSFFEDLEIFK